MYLVPIVVFFQCYVLSMFRVCCAFISAFLCFVLFPFVQMAQALQAVLATYNQRLMAMPVAPRYSFRRAAFGIDGAVNRLFLMCLFLDLDIAIQFLKDTGLIPSQITFPTCGLNMNAVISSGRDAVGVLLPCALSLDQSSTDRGLTIAVSRFRRFCI
jgi:hypothetical protein